MVRLNSKDIMVILVTREDREKVVMNRIVTKKMEGMFDLEYICQLS